MSKRFTYLFTLALPLAAAGLAIGWMDGWGGGQGTSLVYETQPADKGTVRRTVATSGPVRALVTVSVGSQLSGQIEAVNVDFNSQVMPGDLLAVLDAKSFSARVAQARADLASAEAALRNQEALEAKAQSVLRLAERTVERQRTLAAKGFASTAALDSATRDVEVGKADIAVAEAQIASAKATVEQRKAQLNQATIDLERTEIRAPIEGTVISRTVDPGQTVAASLQAPELFKIAQDLSRIRIEAQVNEADVGAVADGNPVTFTVDAYPERRFQGRVTQVRLAATELNNVVTYTVIIEAENSDRKLFPGMTANVTIESAVREDVLRVSNDALRYRPREEPQGSEISADDDRWRRLVDRVRGELDLSEAQLGVLMESVRALSAEIDSSSGGTASSASDQAATRQRYLARIEQALTPIVTDDQRPYFDMWRQGRSTTHVGYVWVLGARGLPERRIVRLGITDARFTEVTGGDLKEGERVIARARQPTS